MSSAPQYDNTNSGVMFGNFDSNEPKDDRKPNFEATVDIEGRAYRIAGWVRYSKPESKLKGRKYCSLKVERKSETIPPPAPRSTYDWGKASESVPAPRQTTPIASGDFDDDIPF